MTAVPDIGTTEMYVHHAVALLSLAVAAQVHCMHVYLMMVLLSELTTPFVSNTCISAAATVQQRLFTDD